MPTMLTQLERCRWRASVRWSAALHGLLVGLLVAQALWIPSLFRSQARDKQVVEAQYERVKIEPLEVEVQIDERPWIARDAEDPSYAQIDLSDPRWDEILREPSRHFSAQKQSDADIAAGFLLHEQLTRSIEASAGRSQDENLASLAELSGRLTAVSSEETVDELSGTINRLTGAQQRATQPKQGITGEFDHSTAQPHDCRKEDLEGGKAKYVVVMIDAAGRTQEIEVDEATGEQLYKTMQIVKSNPLLERVYRGVVMSILDKLLAPNLPK